MRSVALLALLTLSCGARTGLLDVDAGPRPPECKSDKSCDNLVFCDGVERCMEGRCIPGAPVVCMGGGGDRCNEFTCDEAARACGIVPVTADRDGDGHRAIRAGQRPGSPDACGDDCDDDDAAVHPGAREVCNGVDDDCNGVIDDNATLTPAGDPVRVSDPATAPSGPGGLVWTGERYASSYWGYSAGKAHVYFSRLTRDGTRDGTPPQRQVTTTPADAYGAALAWTGRVLGAVWQDRRDPAGGYEIYFNRLTPDGEKLGVDQRVSFAPGFSVNPSIAWTGEEFVLVWQDERDAVRSGAYEVYAQRLDPEGRPILANHRLTRDAANSESPAVALHDARVGVAWMDGRAGERAIWFASFARDLRRLTPDARVSPVGHSAVAPAIAWNGDRWVIAWYDDGEASPDHEVWAATRDADGRALDAPRRLTRDASFSRYPSLLPLGDRVLVAWADDRVDNRYALFARTFTRALEPMSAEAQVTRSMSVTGASVYPVLGRGPEGDVGVLFRDQRDGRIQTWFTRMRCAIPR